MPQIDMRTTDEPVVIYRLGLVVMSVCTAVSDEETVERVNSMSPTGISSPWQLSEDEKFATGQPNGCPCEQNPARRHLLLNC